MYIGQSTASSGTGIGQAIAAGIQKFGQHSALAAQRANNISAWSQAAQGNFNQASANNANAIGTDRIAQQYAFNSGQASNANQFTSDMWSQAAGWNESMWEKAAEYNAREAQKNRDWQERMMSTAYQRAVTDMEKAGLNPVLAVTGGGISTGSGSGSAASMGSPEMSGASGAMGTGGLMNGISASEGNFTGQMEYMGGMLGLLSAAIDGISTAFRAFGGLGDFGKSIMEGLVQQTPYTTAETTGKYLQKYANFSGSPTQKLFGQVLESLGKTRKNRTKYH